jgi:hypothetical protein
VPNFPNRKTAAVSLAKVSIEALENVGNTPLEATAENNVFAPFKRHAISNPRSGLPLKPKRKNYTLTFRTSKVKKIDVLSELLHRYIHSSRMHCKSYRQPKMRSKIKSQLTALARKSRKVGLGMSLLASSGKTILSDMRAIRMARSLSSSSNLASETKSLIVLPITLPAVGSTSDHHQKFWH